MEVWGLGEPFPITFEHWENGCLCILYLPKPERDPKG